MRNILEQLRSVEDIDEELREIEAQVLKDNQSNHILMRAHHSKADNKELCVTADKVLIQWHMSTLTSNTYLHFKLYIYTLYIRRPSLFITHE